MIEAVVVIVAVCIIGPAWFVLVDEWRELRAERDEYRAFYEDFHEQVDASMARHPASNSYMPRLRRIK